MPDWWDDKYAEDAQILPDIEIRIARFLGLPLATVRNPEAALTAPAYPGAKLRRVREIDRDRLAPAIHSAIQIAGAAVRSLRPSASNTSPLPVDGLAWREKLLDSEKSVALESLLSDLWRRGIPVVPIDILPTPNFQGAACIVEGRPVILLGHKHDVPGRVAFLIAHEVGHIAAGDCTLSAPVVDEEEEQQDDADIERRADRYATRVLIGSDHLPALDGDNFKELATRASALERQTGADASSLIFAWAAKTRRYDAATMAVKALYRARGARQLLLLYFDRFVDLERATESDRALLQCVHSEPVRDAASH